MFQGLYDKILDQFKALIGDFKPDSAMSDFERAILNSLKNAFPESRVTGCRFHFGQAGTNYRLVITLILHYSTLNNLKNNNINPIYILLQSYDTSASGTRSTTNSTRISRLT